MKIERFEIAGLAHFSYIVSSNGQAALIGKGAFVLDVRSDAEWTCARIAGAQHIMLGDLPNRLPSLPRDRPIVAVCGSGYRSSIAASLLARAGFDDVRSMNGGMNAWSNRDSAL